MIIIITFWYSQTKRIFLYFVDFGNA